jgi:DNA-directed RNA polymerase subunit M/transcription elongation factor TFIIS
MHFCTKCGNMYYLQIMPPTVESTDRQGGPNVDLPDSDVSDRLVYFCKNCGFTDSLSDDNLCVLYTQVSHTDPKYAHVINEYTKYDPTLPRITTMKCPNEDNHRLPLAMQVDSAVATARGGAESAARMQMQESTRVQESGYDVIYFRYDDLNMRFVYVCTVCDTTFTTNFK